MSPQPAAVAPPTAAPAAAGLAMAPLYRRMMAFLYEGVLLFGILVATGLAYGIAVHQTNGLQHRTGLIAVCFFVLGLYFIGTWTHGGQTLAMKTWNLRLLTDAGAPLSPRRALMRYVASWVWFVPPLALASAALPRSVAVYLGVPAAWIALYAASALLHPRRQFWHDALCGTAIVVAPPVVRA